MDSGHKPARSETGVAFKHGIPLKRAHSLVALSKCDGHDDAVRAATQGALIYSRSDAEWILAVDSPPYRSEILDAAHQAHAHLRWLPLQDVAGVGRFVEALLVRRLPADRPSGTTPAALFPEDLDGYEQGIREFLRKNNETRRITIRRLGLSIFNRLVAISGDLMAGALITSRFGTNTRTERFYASYTVESLRRCYRKVASRLFNQVTDNVAPKDRPLRNPVLWQGHVGARLCAKDDEVKRAIGDLKKAIKKVRGVKRKRVEYHNLFTLYTVMLFCFCTSCRPVRTPYLSRARIDKETKFAYLSDKDDDAHHKTRLIWVPKLCRDQMRYYEQHCNRLAREHAQIHDWPDPCFFMTKDPEPIPVVQRTLTEHLKPFLQLPLNFYRLYLRHRLFESEAPPEVIMAWLGHAFAGEEL